MKEFKEDMQKRDQKAAEPTKDAPSATQPSQTSWWEHISPPKEASGSAWVLSLMIRDESGNITEKAVNMPPSHRAHILRTPNQQKGDLKEVAISEGTTRVATHNGVLKFCPKVTVVTQGFSAATNVPNNTNQDGGWTEER